MAGSERRRGTRPGATLLAAGLGFAVVQLDVSVVNVALRSIGADLGGSIASLQWVVNAYTIGFAACILSAGALGDRIGAKRVFVTGFVGFTAASAGCGLAPTLAWLVAARAVQGVGAAALLPCSLSLLSNAFPDAGDRARAVGRWAAAGSIALSGGPLAGGLLTATAGWRAIFFVNAPVGALGVWLTLRRTAETPLRPERGLDPYGQLLAVVTLVSLSAALVEGGRAGFGAPGVLLAGAAFALAAAGFLVVESRGHRPMLPLRLFRNRVFAAMSVAGLLVNVAFYGLIFALSLYFQDVRHDSVLETGLAFAPTTLAVLVTNLCAARLVRRWGTRAVLVGSSLVLVAALAALLGTGSDTRYAAQLGQLVALGAGLGAFVPTMTDALLHAAGSHNAGVASGTLNAFRQTGSVVGVAVFGALISDDLVSGLHEGLVLALVLALGCATLGVLSARRR